MWQCAPLINICLVRATERHNTNMNRGLEHDKSQKRERKTLYFCVLVEMSSMRALKPEGIKQKKKKNLRKYKKRLKRFCVFLVLLVGWNESDEEEVKKKVWTFSSAFMSVIKYFQGLKEDFSELKESNWKAFSLSRQKRREREENRRKINEEWKRRKSVGFKAIEIIWDNLLIHFSRFFHLI